MKTNNVILRPMGQFQVQQRNMIRNDKGTEQDQRKLYEMERKVASLINDGFLKNHGQVMNYLRKKFQERTIPAVFANG